MKEYGFVGAGKMAGAIVRGMLNSGAVKPSQIACACGNDNTGENLSKDTGIGLVRSVAELCKTSKTLVMACKPQQLAAAAETAADADCDMVISILAGTSISRLRQCFPHVKQIVRVMPNMPAQISEGISCFAPESALTVEQLKNVETVLSAIGEYLPVEEAQLDAVTALSGSGPGYIFEFAAAMIEGAKAIGFTEAEATKLVNKTMLGSAKLLCKSSQTADELRIAVSSPGGTTLAALDVFSKSGFRKTVEDALIAAKRRSEELSKL